MTRTGSWEPETRGLPHSTSDLCLNKPSTCTGLCSLHLWQAQPSTRPRALKSLVFGQLPAGENPSGGNESCGCGPCGFFFRLQQSEFLYIFLCSLNCYPLYSSTQSDGTFGKIILSSTPTCDHNFESRNLLSSCGKNKGPEVI